MKSQVDGRSYQRRYDRERDARQGETVWRRDGEKGIAPLFPGKTRTTGVAHYKLFRKEEEKKHLRPRGESIP